ncbi:hypothetical protein L1049_014355 [Liquidambar formosana]|uniref:Uncharacterized protein n=1 Tax=Liquidambar formosana TaxID=63359 RepID=A0AAP0WZP0_LIQFO
MASRAFSRSRIPIFASMLLRDLMRVPIKDSITPMKPKIPVLQCDSCKLSYGMRQYHDGRPRGTPLKREEADRQRSSVCDIGVEEV